MDRGRGERSRGAGTILGYTVAWLPLVALAIANGTLRELTYGRHLGELRGHQLSTVTAVAMVALYSWWIAGRWPLPSARRALAAGAIWLLLTVAFEFLFGHWVVGHPWQRLFRDYDLTAGRVWSLFLLFTAFAPWLAYRLRERSR